MFSLFPKTKNNEEPSKIPSRRNFAVENLSERKQPALISSGIIHRKASCSCGGGCPSCQAKNSNLPISQPNDASEIEADQIADKVMRMPENRQFSTKANQNLSETSIAAIQPKRSGENTDIKNEHAGNKIVPSSVEGGGSGIDVETLSFMQNRFGVDFSGVKIHTDSQAARMSREINAKAFTIGSDIYFGEMQYQPGSESGKHLLAHELAHTIQQEKNGGANKSIHRKAGQDAQDSWNSVIQLSFSPDENVRKDRGKEAIKRMLATQQGGVLINQLWGIACGRTQSGSCQKKIQVNFVDESVFLNAPCGAGEASGCFYPSSANSFPYEVYVKNIPARPADSRSIRIGGGSYGTGPNTVFLSHVDDESDMANTLYHELLHVLFVNDNQRRQYPTGHGDAAKGEIDPDFSRSLQAFESQLTAEENRIREEKRAKEQGADQSDRPRSLNDFKEGSFPAPEYSSSGSFGGRFSLGLGYAKGNGIGSSITGILGADLILKKIANLGIGARGVYFSPDKLLTGPALSLRLLNEAENPLFFDIEAGVLFEIPTSTESKITNILAGYGSLGIGQEFGKTGTCFFWRLGGFLVISDRLDTKSKAGYYGGGTGNVGISF